MTAYNVVIAVLVVGMLLAAYGLGASIECYILDRQEAKAEEGETGEGQ